MSDLDQLRDSTLDNFDDDGFGGEFDPEEFNDTVIDEEDAAGGSGGFSSTEWLIIAALGLVNVIALVFLLYILLV